MLVLLTVPVMGIILKLLPIICLILTVVIFRAMGNAKWLNKEGLRSHVMCFKSCHKQVLWSRCPPTVIVHSILWWGVGWHAAAKATFQLEKACDVASLFHCSQVGEYQLSVSCNGSRGRGGGGEGWGWGCESGGAEPEWVWLVLCVRIHRKSFRMIYLRGSKHWRPGSM